MRLFSSLYNKLIGWSAHSKAPYYLAAVSFAESSVFPLPPDIMLVSMTVAKPQGAMYYATVATIASAFGGVLGYIIGAYFLHLFHPLIIAYGYDQTFTMVEQWFQQWGFWIVFIAGFSPIPYKLFTIAAGAMRMAFFPFLLASLIGRGARFFLVCIAMNWCGERVHQILQKYIDLIGWLVLALGIFAYLLIKLTL